MQLTQTSLGNGESYVPSQTDEWLWWMATAEKELIQDCVVDRNRYRIIGAAVAATWCFATLAWTYFFSTTVSNAFMYIPLGIFMGIIVLCIDRALIKGINKFNKNRLTPFLFRGLLALTIGTFMAQPAVLALFDKEVRLQTSLDNEKRKQQKRTELEALYAGRSEALMAKKNGLEKQLIQKYGEVSKARNGFIAETDGSGGSGKIGISNIAVAKRAEYQKREQDYADLQKTNQPLLDSIAAQTSHMDREMQQQEALFMQLLNDGFLTRIQALENLVKGNDALAFRYYLIVIILMLIELLPVIAKTMLPAGTYDEKVRLREELEKEMAVGNIRHEQHLKEMYNRLATEQDEAAIQAFFELTKEDRHLKIQQLGKKWKDEGRQTFDGFWEKVKQEVLTKQEN
ncbi:MAG: DUF4407 domain-containing protein [Chitinophagaceae bacterium]